MANPLYTPFMEQVGATVGNAMMRKDQNKLAQSAYMGDQDAMSQLMGVNPELAQKIDASQTTKQQNKIAAAQKAKDKQREMTADDQEVLGSIKGDAGKFNTFEEAQAFVNSQLAGYGGRFAHLPAFTEEAYEQVRTVEGESAPASFEGTSMGAQTMSMMTRGVEDPEFRNTPEYAAAYYEETKPRVINTPTGQILHEPSLPSIFKPPGAVKTEAQEIEDIKAAAESDVKVIPGTEKEEKTTEGEKSSAGYYSRMISAASRLERLGDFDSASLWEQARGVTNITTSPELQQYRQGADDWIRAKLRKESGAVIGKSEMDKEYQVYFPQIGDRQAVIDQKAESRTNAENAMKLGAGKAAKKITEGKGPKISEGNLSVTIDGQTHKFPSLKQLNAYREAAGI